GHLEMGDPHSDDLVTLIGNLKLLDQISADTEDNPDRFCLLVAMGADDQGVPHGDVKRMVRIFGEASALAEDESQPAERRESCRRIAFDSPLADALLDFAIAGQRVVNMCGAMPAAERPAAH